MITFSRGDIGIKWLGVERRRAGGEAAVAGGYGLLSSHDPGLAPGPRPGPGGAGGCGIMRAKY